MTAALPASLGVEAAFERPALTPVLAPAGARNAKAVPRPGPVWGPYPMREHEQLPSRALAAWARQRLRCPAAPSRRRAAYLLARMRLHEAAVLRMSPAAEALVRERLRMQLGRDGLVDELCAQALALVAVAIRRHLGHGVYDTQVLAAWTMLGNRLIEMATGEGKTLAALLCAATAALAGVPVHVLTSNDYLAERDAQSLQPIYAALGLSVGCVQASSKEGERRTAYACDVAYATAREIAFDHLRDRLGAADADGGKPSPAGHARPVLRGLCMAVLDEADSVLVDEAAVPMILSMQVQAGEETKRLRLALYLARQMQPGEHAQETGRGQWSFTQAGRDWLDARAPGLGSEWRIRRFREETVGLALAALHSFRRDVDYVVHDDEIQIVDVHTGRRAEGRAWSRGLHQLVGLKETLAPAPASRTMMQMTYQQFFPRYLRLCGQSGTLAEARRELLAVYGLTVVPVPTARPSRRRDEGTRVLADAQAKWQAVVDRVRELSAAGRPVLIGTGSVADSERLSAMLQQAGIVHRVLNARQDAEEAAVVAAAGQGGAVTVATQMAGRGTDIAVADAQDSAGGLHVINASLHPARRIDRQLDGRSARRGQQGSHQRLVALDEESFAQELPQPLLRALSACVRMAPAAGSRLAGIACAFVQRVTEARAARARWALLQQEESLASGLAWTGRHHWD
jgi:preprotein translocase subunit SecA